MDVGIDRGVDSIGGRVDKRMGLIGQWYRYGHRIDREGGGGIDMDVGIDRGVDSTRGRVDRRMGLIGQWCVASMRADSMMGSGRNN